MTAVAKELSENQTKLRASVCANVLRIPTAPWFSEPSLMWMDAAAPHEEYHWQPAEK